MKEYKYISKEGIKSCFRRDDVIKHIKECMDEFRMNKGNVFESKEDEQKRIDDLEKALCQV